MDTLELKRMWELEEENAKLKKMFADVSLQNQAMKELFAKKGLVTAAKRTCAQDLVERGVDITSACKLADISRSTYCRPERDWRKQDAAVIDAINNELKRSPQAGFWKCFGRIRHKDYPFNHKRVHRVYRWMGLNLTSVLSLLGGTTSFYLH